MSRRRTRIQAQPAVTTVPTARRPSRSLQVSIELRRRAAERQARTADGGHDAYPEAAAAGDMAPASSIDGSVTTTVNVRGMTCRSCEVRIQRHVGRLPHVQQVRASAARGRVEIVSAAPLRPSAIVAAIGKAGYEVGGSPWLTTDPTAWATAAAGVALVGALALIAQATGIGDASLGADQLSDGGIVIALLLGLAAGVSTCMALVGGLVLAVSASSRAGAVTEGDQGALARLRPAAVFVGGRIAGYAVLGAGLGAVGASLAPPPQLTAVLMIGVAVVMALLGARLTGLSPRLAGWAPSLPIGLARRLGVVDGGTGAYSDRRTAALGAATFFLPCGFTQAIQLFALSTGSPLLGAALLGAFAIGTAPGLLALAGLPVVAPAAARPALMRVAGVVVLAFALLNADAGLRLSGFSLPSLFAGDVAAAPLPGAGVTADGTQHLTTYQDLDGYRPGNAAIYAGIPTTWTIESTNAASCASSLVVPQLGIRVLLATGSNVIHLPALRAGRLTYSCSMGMYGGSITIVDAPRMDQGS
jgi:sulfite exporter TauE/SafE/copper chaperone CopZ